jgi:hypothetical protein
MLRLGLWAGFYFLVFTPLSMGLRILWPDPLRLERKPGTESHWQKAKAPGYTSLRSTR